MLSSRLSIGPRRRTAPPASTPCQLPVAHSCASRPATSSPPAPAASVCSGDDLLPCRCQSGCWQLQLLLEGWAQQSAQRTEQGGKGECHQKLQSPGMFSARLTEAAGTVSEAKKVRNYAMASSAIIQSACTDAMPAPEHAHTPFKDAASSTPFRLAPPAQCMGRL